MLHWRFVPTLAAATAADALASLLSVPALLFSSLTLFLSLADFLCVICSASFAQFGERVSRGEGRRTDGRADSAAADTER